MGSGGIFCFNCFFGIVLLVGIILFALSFRIVEINNVAIL
jgi:hypothetical protein